MKYVTVQERLAEIKKLTSMIKFEKAEDIFSTRKTDIDNWEDTIGTLLQMGRLIIHDGIKYLVMQTVTPTISQKPNDIGMYAIYRPYRGKQTAEWLIGEYVEKGWIRTLTTEVDDTIVTKSYTAIQNPNTNIHAPSLVPSIWEEIIVEDEI